MSFANLCDQLDIAMIPLGPGSKEKKAVFEAVVARLELPLDRGLSKPHLAGAIVEHAGLKWGSSCFSTGNTITAEGLERVLAAVTMTKDGRRAGSSDAHRAENVGVSYRTASAHVDAPPRELVADWANLDKATREHSDLQNEIAAALRSRSLEPQSPGLGEPQYDLVWRLPDGRVFVCEVKSAKSSNKSQQFRLGLGQVLEYRYRLEDAFGLMVVPVLAVTTADSLSREVCERESVGLIERSTLATDLDHVLGDPPSA